MKNIALRMEKEKEKEKEKDLELQEIQNGDTPGIESQSSESDSMSSEQIRAGSRVAPEPTAIGMDTNNMNISTAAGSDVGGRSNRVAPDPDGAVEYKHAAENQILQATIATMAEHDRKREEEIASLKEEYEQIREKDKALMKQEHEIEREKEMGSLKEQHEHIKEFMTSVKSMKEGYDKEKSALIEQNREKEEKISALKMKLLKYEDQANVD